MQLESFATPQSETTPELRYASLHRAVERGLASDEVLRELVEICLQLGHVDEALRVHRSMQPGRMRDLVHSQLVRRGLIETPADGKSGEGWDGGEHDEPTSRDHLLDAVQFLTQGQMPAVALLTMLAFPLVLGLGGFLTAGGSPWLLAGLAALPGLCVLGVVGALGRRIFVDGCEGSIDVPPIPGTHEMVRAARRHLGDHLLILGVLVMPSVSLLWFGAPLVSALPSLLIGMFLTPMALVLRQSRGDFAALSPAALLRGISRASGYVAITGAFWLAYAPAAIAFWLSLGNALWLQLSVVGPLSVLPMLATARLLGTFVDVNKQRFGPLLWPGGKARPMAHERPHAAPRTAQRAAPARPAATRPAPGRPRSAAQGTTRRAPGAKVGRPAPARSAPARPAAGAAAKAPQVPAASQRPPVRPGQKQPAAPAQSARAQQPGLPPRPSGISRRAQAAMPDKAALKKRPAPPARPAPEPRAIEGRAPRPASQRPPVRPTQQAPTQTQAEPEQPARPGKNGMPAPDLSQLPGATLVRGEDRERLGASARRQ